MQKAPIVSERGPALTLGNSLQGVHFKIKKNEKSIIIQIELIVKAKSPACIIYKK